MWVKICGQTCAEDAVRSAELGADAVGFVFAPSVRRVTVEQVKAISAVMPQGVERVGVFGTGGVHSVAEAAREAGLTSVQLHGGLDLDFAAQLGGALGPEIGIIQTLHWRVDEDAADVTQAADLIRQQLDAVAQAGRSIRVLVDAKVGSSAAGGTGRSFNWQAARDILHAHPGLQIVVAGGLRPENVADAVKVLHPWGVDVASGVEREPGRKDLAKVKLFIENARGVA